MKKNIIRTTDQRKNRQISVRTAVRSGGTQMDELIKKAQQSLGG